MRQPPMQILEPRTTKGRYYETLFFQGRFSSTHLSLLLWCLLSCTLLLYSFIIILWISYKFIETIVSTTLISIDNNNNNSHLHFGALLPRPLFHSEFLLQLGKSFRHIVNFFVQLPVLRIVLVEYRLVLASLLN